MAADGTPNLAPFSQFNNLSFDPPLVMFASNQTLARARKDSVNNAEATGVFCWQLATSTLRDAVNATAEGVGPDVDEFVRAGLAKVWSQALKTPVPMVGDSPVRFECEYVQTVRLPGSPPMGTVDMVIGRVVGVYIDEAVLTDGRIDVRKTQPIARLGYFEYGTIGDVFEMIIPGDKAGLYGLEGNAESNRKEEEKSHESGV
jgi:flavin reductase (DIM6/NTAB) family NADH-FMN oxidoreductase RutF